MKYFAILALLSCLFSCKKDNLCDCLKGTGTQRERVTFFSPFHQVEVFDLLEVELRHSGEFKMIAFGGEKLIPLVEGKVIDGKLIIRDENKCQWSRSYKNKISVVVFAPEFKTITQFGTGILFSKDTLKGAEILMEIRNSGDIRLTLDASSSYANLHASAGDFFLNGKSGVSYIFNSGNGFINAENLESDITFLVASGTGETKVRARNWLVGENSGFGDVSYWGDPDSTSLSASGSGNFIRK